MSSPGTYPRCSAKSTEAPKYGDRCIPLMNPSTTERATSSRFPTRARTTGSTNRAPVSPPACSSFRLSYPFGASWSCARDDAALHPAPGHRDRVHQLVDERVARHSLGLRVEVREHAV